MTMQQLPESGINLIKEFEGCAKLVYADTYDLGNHRLLCGDATYRSYKCPDGVWTIGWGTTKNEYNEPIKQGDTATQEEVDRYLLAECDAGMFILSDTIPYWSEMSDDQRGALLSFAYNVGWHFYGSSGFDTITRELQNRNWLSFPWIKNKDNPGVPDALMLYVKGNGQVLPGLVRRRQAEADLWLQGLNNAQLFSLPEQPMTEPTTTFEDFKNTYTYYDPSNPNQNNALLLAYGTLEASQLLSFYFASYRTPVEPPPSNNLLQPFTFFDQKDNGPEGWRQCQTTSLAMCLRYIQDHKNYQFSIPINDDKDYLAVVESIHGGDTTLQATHKKALAKIGAPGRFITNASAEVIKAEIDKGYPVAVGYLHDGHVSSPSGSGHYCVIHGYNANSWATQDPYGDPDLINGGWISSGIGCGQNQSYSFQNFDPRLFVNAPNDGWIWVFS